MRVLLDATGSRPAALGGETLTGRVATSVARGDLLPFQTAVYCEKAPLIRADREVLLLDPPLRRMSRFTYRRPRPLWRTPTPWFMSGFRRRQRSSAGRRTSSRNWQLT